MLINLLAAAGGEAPETQFGFTEAMEQGGVIAWSIFGVLVIMSVGSFYILFTKFFEQQKILNQYKGVARISGKPVRSRKALPSSTRTAPGASSSMTRTPLKTSTPR
jgi:hypothetical protein